jgi:hypothetical protein
MQQSLSSPEDKANTALPVFLYLINTAFVPTAIVLLRKETDILLFENLTPGPSKSSESYTKECIQLF